MEREIKTVELPISKAKVVMYSFMTGREWQLITKETEVDKSTELAIKMFIVSFNDEVDKDKIFDLVLDSRLEDFRVINVELKELLNILVKKKQI